MRWPSQQNTGGTAGVRSRCRCISSTADNSQPNTCERTTSNVPLINSSRTPQMMNPLVEFNTNCKLRSDCSVRYSKAPQAASQGCEELRSKTLHMSVHSLLSALHPLTAICSCSFFLFHSTASEGLIRNCSTTTAMNNILDAADLQSYQYTPLEVFSSQIRLLEVIDPLDFNCIIRCRLTTWNLDSAPVIRCSFSLARWS
jgi:hypothetical protein